MLYGVIGFLIEYVALTVGVGVWADVTFPELVALVPTVAVDRLDVRERFAEELGFILLSTPTQYVIFRPKIGETVVRHGGIPVNELPVGNPEG